MSSKRSNYYVLLLLSIAFLLRLYAASAVPLIYDEQNYIKAAKEITVFPNIFDLKVKGVESIRSPDQSWNTNREGMVRYYLFTLITVNLSKAVFGESIAGMRLLFIVFGILSLFFIYKLVEEAMDTKAAVLVLAILTVSQLHIGISRIMLHSPYHFFIVLTIYLFFKALRTSQKKWMYLTGITLGLGFLYYPWMLSLVPIFFIFLTVEKEYRIWLKLKATYAAFFTALLIIVPYSLWTARELVYKMTVDKPFFQIGFSLRAFYLYFSELFAKLSEIFGIFRWDGLEEELFINTAGGLKLLSRIEPEFPVINWLLSLIIFIGLFYSFKNKKNELVRFSQVMFCFLFAVISIASGNELLVDYSWADITIYPGVILCANLFISVGKKRKLCYFMPIAFMIYLIINSISFINLPDNFYGFPRGELFRLYLHRAEFYLHNEEPDKAEKICRWVLANKRADKQFILKAEKLLSSPCFNKNRYINE